MTKNTRKNPTKTKQLLGLKTLKDQQQHTISLLLQCFIFTNEMNKMSNIKGTSIRKLKHFKGKKQPLVFLHTLYYCTLSLCSFSVCPTEMFLYISSLLMGPVQQNRTLGFNGQQFSVPNNSCLCVKLCPMCDVLWIKDLP